MNRARTGWLLLFALCTQGGCASYPRLTKPPLEAPTEGVTWLDGEQGARLFFSVNSRHSEPRGVVFFALGPETTAAEPYPRFTEALHAAGFTTAVVHPRGTGFSDGLRGDIDDFALFLSDLELGLHAVHSRFAGQPIFIFGHSAGAAMALAVAARPQPRLSGLVLVNPAFKLRSAEGMSPTFKDYVAFAFNLAFRRTALTVDMNSNPRAAKNAADRDEALAMQADPLVVRYFSMRFMLAQQTVMTACAKNAASIDSPVLLLQGARDELVDPRGHDEILEALGSADKVKLVAPEGGHGASAVETMVAPLVEWLLNHR